MFKTRPQLVGELIGETLRELGLEIPLAQKRLLDAWGVVAGPLVEQYTTEKLIKNQTLVVRISNPALRQDLLYRRSELIPQLNAAAGMQVIFDIKIS